MRNNYFFIIGAQRCGTTYLYHQLDEHPEICMAKPIRPEPKFFLEPAEYKKGRDFYVEKYFKSCTQSVRGEKSTSYIEFEGALERIRNFFPEAKIMIVLRNPVDRALSNYRFSVKNGFESRTLEEVFLHKKKNPYTGPLPSVSPFDYLRRGEYIRYVRTVYDNYPPENIQIVVFEHMIANKTNLADIYNFLGVDPSFKPDSINKVINASEGEEEISSEVLEALSQHFLPFNRDLEEFLQISLSAWEVKR